ncbi:MAG TPA: 2-succinyl-5-enolpyruvyl-6-hydroxy-3-cyclohexene-1-carboxylic-acid synthase [Pseudonocardiaceae bacterium]
MNPSTAQARVLVDELVRNGVRHVVLSPGSRNAPLSFALHEAAVAGRITLHVRIDERSAGFLALGLARGLTHRPGCRGLVAVTCTSGTAVANLHPAVLEAQHAGRPLLLLTADRPSELVGTGANQTVRQSGLFGPEVAVVDFPVAERRAGQNAVWRGLVCRAAALAATGRPVQVNLPFREPLVPDSDPEWPEPLDGRADGLPWTTVHPPGGTVVPSGDDRTDHLGPRTVVVVGDAPAHLVRPAGLLAARAGWPVIAEPTGAAGAVEAGALVLQHGALLLAAGPLPEPLRPDAVLVVGRPTLSRGVQRLLRETPVVHVVGDPTAWVDPQHVAAHVSSWSGFPFPTDEPGSGSGDGPAVRRDPAWARDWAAADAAAASTVDRTLATEPWPTGLHVARDLVAALPPRSVLFLGSSNPVRDVDLVGARRGDLLVLANRGVAGIDGTVSSAMGAVLGAREVDGRLGAGYALLGDLTFLHDTNGLLLGPGEVRPDLAIVVVNDDGGGIFSLLEQGAPEHATVFERVFGTPHGTDLAALCAAHGVPHRTVGSREEFLDALRPAPGLRVIEVRTGRDRIRDLHTKLREAVRAAVRREIPQNRTLE